ncbi:hypothetical protein IJ674_07120 [bacterium]|nr:hypothetical protein [bacterium]
MDFKEIFTDIPVLIVLFTFVFSLFYCCIQYIKVNKNLKTIIKFISTFKKNDLNFRFKELDGWMLSNPYVSVLWIEFKNTLVFSESVALKEGDDYQYQDISSTVQNVQTTFDPLYFFNEETLVTSKFNYKMVQTIPTILTGFGPLFTFMKIAIAFGMIDFSSPEKTINSVAAFMQGMQAAAFVSVVAVSSSLIYLLVEKALFQQFCKKPLGKIQNIIGELFASISSEKFLYEILRESKIQNNSAANIIGTMPKQFKSAFNETMAANLVPYLENMIFGLNQLNKQMKEVAKGAKGGDEVDGLF